MEIIAELGVNWNSLQDFWEMITQCKELNIKYVKMQLWDLNQVPKEVHHMFIGKKKAKYFFDYAKNNGISLFYTCFTPAKVQWCEEIGVPFYKVRFFDGRNLPLYRALKKTTKPIFVSCVNPYDTIFTNMAKYQGRIAFLYCVPEYPATYEAYRYINNNFSGISDHTPDLRLFIQAKLRAEKNPNFFMKWFEMHVCLDNEAYERNWSKSFEELQGVL